MTWTTLPAGTSRLDGVEEADELLMAVALHVAADDGAVEHVERGEQRRGAVALVVVGHGAGAALLHRQARLGAVERLDLALLVDRQHDGMGRRIDIEADDVAQLVDELRIVRELEAAASDAAASPCALQMRCTVRRLMPAAFAITAPSSGSPRPAARSSVSATTSSTHLRSERRRCRGGPRLVAQQARRRPPRMKRSCQRQTQVFDLPVAAHDLVRADPVGAQTARSRPARHASAGRCGLRRSPPAAGDRRR